MSAAPARAFRPLNGTVPLAPRTPMRGSPALAPRVPHLRPVATPHHSRSLVPFIALCVTIVAAAMVAVLMLNTSMAAQAYQVHDMKLALADLADQRAELLTSLDAAAAPQHLAASAAALGMVATAGYGYISLSDGTVVDPHRGSR